MAEREVIWTKTANQQLQGILEFWLKKNGSTEFPKQILQTVHGHIKLIADRPHSFRLTEHGRNRVCVIGIFSIYFKIQQERIFITAFWDNRQDPKKLERTLRKRKDL